MRPGTNLRERVLTARTASVMTAQALQRASGLSARTLRDIESGNTQRHYSVRTLAALDDALGWERGTAWQLWQADAATTSDTMSMVEVAEELAAMRQLLDRRGPGGHGNGEEPEPSWARDVIALMRLLSNDDRRWVISLIERLARI